jgi:dihydrolipoamide dehydrogenase
LPGCDDDVTQVVLKSFKRRGITVKTGVKVTGHTPDSDGTTVQFGDGESVRVDLVVVSVGRRPLSESLGLRDSGTQVEVDERGFVVVDEFCRTAEPGVYAIGDLIATPQLAHIGFAEGILAIREILGESPVPVDYGKVPWCIYCHPEVAFAGHSEASAQEAGLDIITSKHRFLGNGRALIVGESDGLVKVIAERDPKTGQGGKIIGVHMVGPWVTEQLGQGYLAVNWEATVDEVSQFIQPHPTMSELFGESVMALTGRSLHG